MTDRTAQLRENLQRVHARIEAASHAAGREPDSVALLPVTKFHPAADIARLVSLGVRDVAENREQEARAKAGEVREARIHMVGQIQTKKANSVARWASSVHSLDSGRLAQGLDRGMALALERGERTSTSLSCFLQLSTDGDTHRGGVTGEHLPELVEIVEGATHLELSGLMCVPPLGADPAEVFSTARQLTDQLSERVGRPLRLSAGMSGDLETAIHAGSDIVRVGTGVLGERPVA